MRKPIFYLLFLLGLAALTSVLTDKNGANLITAFTKSIGNFFQSTIHG